MVTKLGVQGNEKTLADPHESPRREIVVGLADRMLDGSYHMDYAAAGKWIWRPRWEELSETQLTGTDGVLTAADRTQTLRWLSPDAGKVREDEQGASWGPEHHGLSLADGQAFVRVQGVDLSPWAGTGGVSTKYLIDLVDSSGKKAQGHIADADAVEGLGSELVTNGDMEAVDSWPDSGTPITNERSDLDKHGGTYSRRAVTDASGWDGFQQDLSGSLVAGKLYKIDVWYKVVSGVLWGHLGTGATTITFVFDATESTWTQRTVYYTFKAGNNGIIAFRSWDEASEFFVDDVSVKEVLHVGTDGVHIVSAQNGATRNWEYVDAAFDYNDSAYTFQVHEPFVSVEIADHGIEWELLDTAPKRYNVALTLEEK